MSKNAISCLTQVSSFLKVPIGKVSVDSNSQVVRLHNNSSTTGFIRIIFDLLNESNSKLLPTLLKDKAEILQWLEYSIVYAIRYDLPQVLKELNGILSCKTYLAASRLTIADVVLFYILHHSIEDLSYLDKERYLNVSRWFDNLQQDSALRQKNKTIDFNTNYLSINAPARH